MANEERRLKAEPEEQRILQRRLGEWKAAVTAAERAQSVVNDCMTLFTKRHGIAASTFVALEGDTVVVRVPSQPPAE